MWQIERLLFMRAFTMRICISCMAFKKRTERHTGQDAGPISLTPSLYLIKPTLFIYWHSTVVDMSVRDVWASALQQLRQDNVHLQLEIHDLQNTLACMWSHAGISIQKPELHIQAPEARGTFSDRREELWQANDRLRARVQELRKLIHLTQTQVEVARQAT